MPVIDQSLEMIEIYYQETIERLEMKPHFHNCYEIIFVTEGKAQMKINNRLYDVEENSMAFISNLESHELIVKRYPYKRYFILIKPGYLQTVINEPVLTSIFKHRPSHFNHILQLDPSTSSMVRSIIGRLYMEAEKRMDFWETAIKLDLNKMFIELYRSYKASFPLTTVNKSMKMIIDIQKYIEEHCTEPLTLKDLAARFYTDMYHLSHAFKKVTGFTFKEYLIRQRISRAKDRLFFTNEDITQVGINSGFNNVNHFIRIFKKFEGVTPYQYRINCRKELTPI